MTIRFLRSMHLIGTGYNPDQVIEVPALTVLLASLIRAGAAEVLSSAEEVAVMPATGEVAIPNVSGPKPRRRPRRRAAAADDGTDDPTAH